VVVPGRVEPADDVGDRVCSGLAGDTHARPSFPDYLA
jgi:hypothetical protein